MARAAGFEDLKILLQSFHPLITMETVEEERVRALLAAAAADLRLSFFEWSITQGLARWPRENTLERAGDPLVLLAEMRERGDRAVFHLKDFAPQLTTPAIIRGFREILQQFEKTHSTVVITGEPIDLPPDLRHIAVTFSMPFPTDSELRQVVKKVYDAIRTQRPVRLNLTEDVLREILRSLSGLTLNQARQIVARVILDDNQLGPQDIPKIVRHKATLLAEQGPLEFYPVDEAAAELGGFSRLKTWLERAKVGFSDEARALGLPAPRGVLFVGVQGCGKSLAARFIAHQWRLPLLRLDAGRLYDKYVGETEHNFRKATELAEAMAPIVLWIDEIEKAFAQGGSGESDGGLSKRLFGSFLTWLQEKKREVFVVGAANELKSLPPELLRKGRFDEIFFVDLPSAANREEIIRIHLRRRKQAPATFDVQRLAAQTEGFSGAEIEQGLVSSLYVAIAGKHPLTTDHVAAEFGRIVPLSTSRREEIAELRSYANGRFTPVA